MCTFIWQGVTIEKQLGREDSGVSPSQPVASKGLPKTKLSQYGKLCQEKKAWRDKSGTDRGSQSASVEHGQGTQGERTADVYGADGASARRRRPEASRTRTWLESEHYSQRETRSGEGNNVYGCLQCSWS